MHCDIESRGQYCGDIELTDHLANAKGQVPLVLDLHITHERFGSTSDSSFNGHWHYPNDIDGPLNLLMFYLEVLYKSISAKRHPDTNETFRTERREGNIPTEVGQCGVDVDDVV